MVWQHLLRNWLREQAAGQLGRAARDAAVKARQPDTDAADPQKRDRCHVGLVFSSKAEAGGVVDRLRAAYTTQGTWTVVEGGLGGRRVAVVRTDPKAAAAATRALIEGHAPAWIIAAGFCTALQEGLQRGDVLVANSISDPAGRRLSIDVQLPTSGSQQRPVVRTGRLLTTDRDLDQPALRAQLGQQHDALAADTTSLAVAEVCRGQDVRCLVIKIVQYAIEDRGLRERKAVRRQASLAGRLGAATGALIRRPGSAKDFLEEQQQALTLADRLAVFLEGVVKQLARGPAA
ncbi:MAG: hypothetical protein GTO53_11485 [Planctomycetales bacterium]|nr:hypothetical protein [Planctomycetales bacterium]NIM09734.1 hypothetical protein [Planctomycetales bacterium]NIN09209.1 hypothetical protein [Planctomycetales bacterium]NIN78306.1 hypothetical protein [Planctomycetales bacterium]NIO35485.1 hypothetical protein [Planctomycetales bacterium]